MKYKLIIIFSADIFATFTWHTLALYFKVIRILHGTRTRPCKGAWLQSESQNKTSLQLCYSTVTVSRLCYTKELIHNCPKPKCNPLSRSELAKICVTYRVLINFKFLEDIDMLFKNVIFDSVHLPSFLKSSDSHFGNWFCFLLQAQRLR
jgi:hypothetical protein